MLSLLILSYFIFGLLCVVQGKASALINNELELYDLDYMPDAERIKLKVALFTTSIIVWPLFWLSNDNPWSNWIWLIDLKHKYQIPEPLSIDQQKQMRAYAAYSLATMYREGLGGVNKDLEQSVNLFRQAATSGQSQAQYELAELYMSGEVIEKNVQEAFYWFKCAANQGHQKAENRLNELTKEVFDESPNTARPTITEVPRVADKPKVTDTQEKVYSIQNILKNREIEYLVHFTKASNLQSIMQHGLVSRDKIDDGYYAASVNDQQRLDNRRNTISTSVSFPNYKMFFKYRKISNESWVVLLLDPQLLLSKSAYFCKHNAADYRIREQNSELLKRPQEFLGMFDNIDNFPSRIEQNLRKNDPTDPQAEILILDTIEPRFIRHVCFESRSDYSEFKLDNPKIKSVLQSSSNGMFSSRTYMLSQPEASTFYLH